MSHRYVYNICNTVAEHKAANTQCYKKGIKMTVSASKKTTKKAAKKTSAKKAVAAGKSAKTNTTDKVQDSGSVVFLHPEDVKVSKMFRVRTGDADIEGMKKSILKSGLLQSPVVYKSGNNVYIVAGYRRLTAIGEIKDDNQKTYDKMFPQGIPCSVIGEKTEAMLAHLTENQQRLADNPVDVSDIISDLMNQGMTTARIASSIGRSATYIRNYIRFAEKASKSLKESVRSGEVTFASALEIMRQKEEDQKKTVEKISSVSSDEGSTDSEKSKKTKEIVAEASKNTVPERSRKKSGEGSFKDMRSLTEIRNIMAVIKDGLDKPYKKDMYNKSHILAMGYAVLKYTVGEISLGDLEDFISKPGKKTPSLISSIKSESSDES